MTQAPTEAERLRQELAQARERIAELEARLDAAPHAKAIQQRDREFASILLDTLQDAVVACDASGQLFLFNRAALEWHGRDAAPLGPDAWADHYGLFEPDGITPLPSDRIPLSQALSGRRVHGAAMTIRAPGQPLRHVEANAVPFHDARGGLLGAVTVLRDVTRRKAMEQEMEVGRAELALVMDMAKLVRWERDLATNVYTFNEAFYALYGTTAEREGGMEMPAETYFREFAHPEDDATLRSILKESHSGRPVGGVAADHRIIRRDGAVRHITVRSMSVLDSAGRPVKRIGANQDITERKELERALELHSAQLALAMDMTMLARWEADPATGTLTLNDQFYALYGTTAEREGGYRMSYERYAREFFHPDDIPHFTAASLAALNSTDPGNIHSVVHRIIRRDGEVRHIRVRFFTLTGQGAPRVVGANQDITEQKLAEEQLLRTTERLQEAQRVAQVGDWDWNPDTGESFWSHQTHLILGLDADSAAPSYEAFLDVLHPDDRQLYLDIVLRALGSGEPYERELRQLRPDGGVVHLLVRGQPVVDASGRVTRLHGTVQDITRRKQAELDLLESRERLRQFTGHVEESLRKTRTVLDHILESMPSAIIALDTRGVVTHWNRYAWELSGKSPAEALGAPLAAAFPWLAGQMPSVELTMQRKRPFRQERMPYTGNGDGRLLDITIYPFGADAVEGAVLRLDDVTERAEIEKMMVQTEKMLSVGGLAAGMAHEINNPLSGILQSAQVIMRRLDPRLPANIQAARKAGCELKDVLRFLDARGILTFLEGIDSSGKRASSIVRNMLGFIRKSPTLRTPAQLGDIVDRAVELASTDYDLKKNFDFRRIRIERRYQPDMPPVPCSAVEIEQVVLNLLTNAAQALAGCAIAGPAPAITLCVRRKGDMAVVEVEDNGPGMDEATQRMIFEPFFTTKPPGEGTGLGLSVSYFIVTRNHRGTFTVASRPGEGTRFTLALPLEDLPDSLPPADQPGRQGG